MIDIYTKLSKVIGRNQEDNNELYDIKKEENWKLNVVIEFATIHSKDKDIIKKCVELSKQLKLPIVTNNEEFWNKTISNINLGLNKDKKAKEATKKVKKTSIDYEYSSSNSYGCGSSNSYGCGSSNSYGCGSSRPSRSSSYGCGSSISYGC